MIKLLTLIALSFAAMQFGMVPAQAAGSLPGGPTVFASTMPEGVAE